MFESIRNSLRAHWRMMVFQAIVMIVLGILAIAVPVVSTLAVELLVGWLFLFSGVAGLIAMLATKEVPAFSWGIVTAALSVIVGILLVWRPAEGALTLTLVLTAFFIAEGTFQTVISISYREAMRDTWGWMLVSGIADLVLAAIVIAGLPASGGYILGILVGVNLITSGWALLMIAFAGRRLAEKIGAA
ncbi:MAG: DUF308 domain-containing protein [Alphaproteobacteria bacterium]